MASLKFLLGMIPSTSKIEQDEKALINEYEKLKAFSDSDQLARYNELHELINSADFIQKRKEIESLQYKNSVECSKEKEFISLKKSKDIVLYFKTIEGIALKKFREMDGSDKIKDFEALEKFIQSSEFKEKEKMKPFTFKDTDEYKKFLEYKMLKSDSEIKSYYKFKNSGQFRTFLDVKDSDKPARYKELQKAPQTEEFKSLSKDKSLATYLKIIVSSLYRNFEKIDGSDKLAKYEELDAFIKSPGFLAKKNMKPITFKDSEEYKKLLEYKGIKASTEIREYYRFKGSKEYSNYLKVDGSTRLARYNELKEYTNSEEFKERKIYLLDKKRFEKTDMFKQVDEFAKLRKTEDIIWYFKIKDSNKFDILKTRELTFNDEFDSDNLDTKKWLTNYFWGEKLLKDRYSVESDLQFYTEKGNFELRNSSLRIITKPQKINGKVWSAAHGFNSKEFSYTSGLINSGKSFRQKYGIFSAKIKLGDSSVKNAFWMLADKITPHINICHTSKGKVWFGHFTSDGKVVKTSVGSRYSNDYFIFTLEWTANKLVWKINGVEAFQQTSNIPQDPMYVLLSGGLDKPANVTTTMEIDWVRIYQFKN
jgi:hypothetical protein